jgi:hypothetical protein
VSYTWWGPWLDFCSLFSSSLLEALSTGTITYLSWREERHLTASWSLNTDLGRLLTQFLSLWIRPCTRDLLIYVCFVLVCIYWLPIRVDYMNSITGVLYLVGFNYGCCWRLCQKVDKERSRHCRTICKNVYLSLFTENMAMTGTNCLKLLIFQSVSMTMVYGFSGSDFETVSSVYGFCS